MSERSAAALVRPRVRTGTAAATARQLRRIALSLAGTAEAAHFDRAAFRTTRIYATLAPDGLTANLRLSPEEQALKCLTAPDAFAPVPNAWGRQGWTTVTLAGLGRAELASALVSAWRHAGSKPARNRKAR